MNNYLFNRLLHEEESAVLEFKKEQYRFVRATDDEKSELLKDILGFANAWRRSDAYILIGVEDVRGGRGSVVGISSTVHLNDHSLPEFVNSLTNQPVRFHYEAFGFEGRQIGIITIDEQTRPIYLKRDYGKLLKEKVYGRRGSWTNPNQPAKLEEIALMRVGSGQLAAELSPEFAHVELDKVLGTTIVLSGESCEMPEGKTIPKKALQKDDKGQAPSEK
ncbi:MAG: ATP-binding protein [Candidatus Hydrogenedentes bacterium]|nr:ATP-binding protein [Candidatus Hydrogenedentota bacterium]